MYYRSYTHMIRDMGDVRFSLTMYRGDNDGCGCRHVACCTPNSIGVPTITTFCPEHGVGGFRDVVCNVPVSRHESMSLRLVDDQTVNPTLYYDSPCILPTTIHEEFERMLSSTVRSSDDTFLGEQYRERWCRGIIVYSCIEKDDKRLCIWSIRPTINWVRVRIDTGITGAYTEYAKVRNMVSRTVCPYDMKDELRMSRHTGNDGTEFVEATGLCAAYLLPPYSPYNDSMSVRSVSIGSSTLQISVIDKSDGISPVSTPLCPNISLIRCLLANNIRVQNRQNYIHIVRERCVTIKHISKNMTISGSCMIIGENGGMQWIGSLKDYATDFQYICSTMNINSNNPSTQTSISSLKEMIKPIYPSGVPRS